MEAGRIVIVGWFEQNASLTSARTVIGAEDGERLANIMMQSTSSHSSKDVGLCRGVGFNPN